jgi:predicted RNA-binding Zn-ribbon protein involved in translation (DUF1610 family)
MGIVYRCPNCGGTEIIWHAGLRKAVCPKDETPVGNYKTENNA